MDEPGGAARAADAALAATLNDGGVLARLDANPWDTAAWKSLLGRLADDKKIYSSERNKLLYIEKNGVEFVFEQLYESEGKFIRLCMIRLNFKIGESRAQQVNIPPHIFGELSKTTAGYQLLKHERRYLDKFITDIRNDNKEDKMLVLNKRASLWAIGHIGMQKKGIKLLIENKLIQEVTHLAEMCPQLSLRGTCLYILNMICHTAEGRNELSNLHWTSHWNANIQWICIPQGTQQFFQIRRPENTWRSFFPLQEEHWKNFYAAIEYFKLKEDQKKLLDTISLMSNQLIWKNANRELKRIARHKQEMFKDRHIFYCVLLLLTFYRFRYGIVQNILMQFKDFFKQPTLLVTLDTNMFFENHII